MEIREQNGSGHLIELKRGDRVRILVPKSLGLEACVRLSVNEDDLLEIEGMSSNIGKITGTHLLEKIEEEDFGLSRLNLSPEQIHQIKQARIEAKDIIERLAPHDIHSWPDLITKLEEALFEAKSNAEIFKPFPVLQSEESKD